MNTKKRSELIADYEDAKVKLNHYKKRENELRLAVIDEFFPNGTEGTLTETFGQHKIKGTFRLNYKLDQEAFADNENYMGDDELACIARKPSIILSAYKALRPEDKLFIDDCVTISPGLPSLAITLELPPVEEDS